MKQKIERVEVNMEELKALLERAKTAVLEERDYNQLKAAVETLGYLTQIIEDKKTTIQRLRQILFGASTETSRNVLKTGAEQTAGEQSEGPTADNRDRNREESENKSKGHGRNGAEAYRGATRVKVSYDSLKPGDRCPECQKGKVYHNTPGYLVRIVGQAPLAATVYELEKLRCNLCGELFRAEAPQGVGPEKYDETSASMIALLKYGSGVPFNRLEQLQGNIGIPLPASTQWEIVQETAAEIEPAFGELIRQAAQGEVVHNDDTTMKVLALMSREQPQEQSQQEESQRSGIFTSGIVSRCEGRTIALFFTGHKHAGENLSAVLAQRAAKLGPPIQMCDALSRNLPGEFKVVLAHCLAHSRRKFVDVVRQFPEECRYLLKTLAEVYRTDALSRQQGMSPEERLRFHQEKSGPPMNDLESWLKDQLEEGKVEPNSGLGQAISYMKKHWGKLTMFLQVPGAPLDNNICERALKKVILHRKNSLFYKTPNGAHVGDLFMSLIHTCQLSGVDPFGYLTELQKHAAQLSQTPQQWMPWNYRDTLQRESSANEADI
ncbi:MAG: IS66 family transposase [bacterium]|nr:IS66 family transposase [bacterium]